MLFIRRLLILGVFLGFTFILNAQEFTIQGKIEHPQSTKAVALEVWDADLMKYKWVQNIAVEKEGSFKLSLPFVEKNLFKLKVYGKVARIAAEKPEKVTGTDKLKINITGSTGNRSLRAFHKFFDELQVKHFAALKKRAMKAVKTKDAKEIAAVEKIKNEKLALFEVDLTNYIDNMGTTVAAYYAVGFMDLNMHLDFFKKIGKKFKQKYPNQNLTRALWNDIKGAERTAIGAVAPDFTLVDVSGKKQSLSAYRGKYVVVEFWASWCLGCRVEYPKLKKIYASYKPQGLEILGVSADGQAKNWKAAVKRDELPWTNLWINKSKVRKDYNISNLPFNLLLDKQGRIIAKKLTPEQLEAKLKEVMSSGK